jgi:hypothetical protein
VELIEQARLRVNTVLELVSQQTIETILELSAEQVAGPRMPGRARGEILPHMAETVGYRSRQSAKKRSKPARRNWKSQPDTLKFGAKQDFGSARLPSFRNWVKNSPARSD